MKAGFVGLVLVAAPLRNFRSLPDNTSRGADQLG